jgi:hypothetical protein
VQDIAGLQFADLICYPAKFEYLARKGKIPKPTPCFSTELGAICRNKYDLIGCKLFD